ncbi:SIS domain-containing protein [Polaromonas aquatica]|uniref:SIS domain-containing protein n=1 Tax=Polaromonas aquatica TaxID=332657 RepID=A0ABW1TS63_9BURK
MHIRPKSVNRLFITSALGEARVALDHLLANEEALAAIEYTATLMLRTFQIGGRIYTCGNGGSMCDAMHFAEELTGRFRRNRPGLAAQAISDVGHLSCVANDFGYDQVFSRYLQSHARAGDCLLAISTSGKSVNVVNAAISAKELGMTVVALTGRKDTQLQALADACIATPAGEFADRAQELHIKVIHILIELIERQSFPDNYPAISG